MSPDPLVGRTIGAVTLTSKLGAGGMATVYAGEDTENGGARVAIKLLSVTAHDAYKARFQRESRIGQGLDHPLLVRVHRFGLDGDFHFMVMDLVEGEDLASVLGRSKALDWPLAAAVGRDVARALAALHERGIIHRDLKPQNVLLDARGTIKLADFGLARWKAAPSELPTEMSLTTTGDAMGTPLYMAPEQFEDAKSVDLTADLYSLGVIVFEALAGRPPFSASTPLKLSILHRDVAPPSLAAMAGSAPDDLRDLTEKLLAKHPEDRIQTAKTAAELFASVAERGKAEPLRLEVPKGSLVSVWNPAAPGASGGIGGVETLPPPPPPPSAARFALGMLALLGVTVAGMVLAKLPAVRLQFASAEEVDRYEEVESARADLADAEKRRALRAAIEHYLRDFGDDGWLTANVRRLQKTPLHVRSNLYYLPVDDALLVFVHKGSYAIGDPNGKDDPNLSDPHVARLQGFLIDRVEVTNARYEAFLARWRAAGSKHRCGRDDVDHDPGGGLRLSPDDDGPKVGLSPWDALEYARFYGRRLPSEDEWEVAASWDPQDAQARLYPWGEREPSTDDPYLANLLFAEFGEVDDEGDFRALCAPAGTFEMDRSGFGLLDVAGNASEWCAGSMPLPGKQPIRGGDLLTKDPLGARLSFRRDHDPNQEPPASVGFRTVVPFAGP